jgi:predicted nucleic acid-binding protein
VRKCLTPYRSFDASGWHTEVLVIDASFAIEASLARAAFHRIRKYDPVAPPLMWSEVTSVLHEMQWRGAISKDLAVDALKRLSDAPIRSRKPSAHLARAWHISEKLGWAKTYDAEYVALAQLLNCPLLTTDARLARGALNEARILGPADL